MMLYKLANSVRRAAATVARSAFAQDVLTDGRRKGRSGNWLALEPLESRLMLSAGPLVIGEIMYNPAAPSAQELAAGYSNNDDFEFIEVQNVSDTAVALERVSLTAGVDFTFGAGTLAPDERVVVVRSQAAFEARYGTEVRVAGEYLGKLSNSGEQLTLLDAVGQPLLDFVYNDAWYPLTDGNGYSLAVVDPHAVPEAWNDPRNWGPSSQIGGSPGADDVPLDPGVSPGDVVINEILSHSDDWAGDWIELHNTTDAPIDVGGWFLSDDSTALMKYRIAEGTEIPAGGFLIFTQREDFGVDSGDPGSLVGFGLSELGEEVRLSSAIGEELTGYSERVKFPAADREVTYGRHYKSTGEVDFVLLAESTPGEVNSPPRVGSVVINEIMYMPLSGSDEFIELYNSTDRDVLLSDPAMPANTWQFIKGVDFSFPQSAMLPAGTHALVVPILPEQFRADYGIPAEVPIWGPYSHTLSDSGETVTLARPGDPEPDGFVPYYVVDQVRYDDQLPWPMAAGGNGSSLARKLPIQYGNDVAQWEAGVIGGTPGRSNQVPHSHVVGRHVFYNNSGADDYDPGSDDKDDDAIAPDKRALLPGETATFANYTSYSRGINGVMVDIVDLPGGPVAASDFEFRVGNSNTPDMWPEVPVPASVTVRRGEGVSSCDRVMVIWDDDTIQRQWLQVTVLANADTGLAEPDVFYFGNAIGETGNSANDAMVTSVDEIGARGNPRIFDPAAMDDPYDFNRDRMVSATDQIIARKNRAVFAALKLIDAPSVDAVVKQAAEAELVAPRTSSGSLAWLSDAGQTSAEKRPTGKDEVATVAVDAVLALLSP